MITLGKIKNLLPSLRWSYTVTKTNKDGENVVKFKSNGMTQEDVAVITNEVESFSKHLDEKIKNLDEALRKI